MALHLLKLCVGADSVETLQDWIGRRLAAMKAAGQAPEQFHTTRMVPKRAAELVDGGSLYWVIKGNIQARQRLLDIRPFIDADGISRCNLVLEPVLHETSWAPRRPVSGMALPCSRRTHRRILAPLARKRANFRQNSSAKLAGLGLL